MKAATRVKASNRSILRALHKDNIYFRKLREKPKLTTEDVKARFSFAQKYHEKSKNWWINNVHASIDGKHFQAYLNGDQRVRAAQHATFGAYRAPGKGLSGGYVKPRKPVQSGISAKKCVGHRRRWLRQGLIGSPEM